MSLPGWIVLSVFVLIAALEIIIPVIYVGIPILRERRKKRKRRFFGRRPQNDTRADPCDPEYIKSRKESAKCKEQEKK